MADRRLFVFAVGLTALNRSGAFLASLSGVLLALVIQPRTRTT